MDTYIQTIKPEILINEYNSILKFTNYGIIPLVIGYSTGIHEDPLYAHIDLIISSLLDKGYVIVE